MPNLDKLNEDRVEQALKYLSSTDEQHAELSGEVKMLEEVLKSVKAALFLESEGGVAEREQKALASVKYIKAVNEWASVWKAFKVMANRREHEVRVVEIWQTLSANRRKGNL